MKTNYPWAFAVNGIKRIFIGLVLAAGAILTQTVMAAGPAPVDLGSCSNFAILAATKITSTGGGTVNGDVGLYPGDSIVGFPPAQVNGTIHIGDSNALQAQTDLIDAYNDAAGRTNPITMTADIGGQTLPPGLYWSGSTLEITGDLTLDASNDVNAVWIFQIVTALTTADGAVDAPHSQVILTNGAQAKNIFWQVGSSATLGTYSVFKGTIMAQASITMGTDSIVDGRALARTAAVTFDALVGGLPILSISVSPSTWAVGTVATGTVNMSVATNKISVTNDGNVAETFTLQISVEDDQNPPNTWTHSLTNGAGNNQYVLSGIFCAGTDGPMVAASFNQTAGEDVLTTDVQDAATTKFAYDGGSADGVAVPAGAGRSLWLRFDAPTAGAGGIKHTITVRVGCFQP